ncbi:Conserved_hypothetical protein [Hexamita inflata]|uniref:Uncharacterized protein n=1 Tax=Hexamita inflata TaxID=28002 RepID=A0AA86Q431_9EUKA|nr:Conserved hypothetical protein [Hexamita inflata]CAI9950196.1 Conserved hypothetical protein [Hexamita inflata]
MIPANAYPHRHSGASGASQDLKINIPTRKMVGIFPFIVAFFVIAIEILVAFIDIIVNAAKGKTDETYQSLSDTKGVLSSSVIQFHLTWGLVLTATLSFVENSLRWLTNKNGCRLFGTLNAIFCTFFVITSVYTWMWANDAAGMTMFCKYVLLSVKVRYSPEQIKMLIYTDTIKYYIDLAVSWLFPAQCVVVLIDCIFSMCCKPRPLTVQLKVKTMEDGTIVAKLDPNSIDPNLKPQKNPQKK